MATYDLLKKIDRYVNENVSNQLYSDRTFCIQEVFDTRYRLPAENSRFDHICAHEDKGFITKCDCDECLQNWLNEEVYVNGC